MNARCAILLLLVASLSGVARALDFTEQGEYVGSSDCRRCHERFYELWSTSHHGLAMRAFSGTLAKTLSPMKAPLQVGKAKFFVELSDRGGRLRETRPDGTEKTRPILHAMGGKNVYFFLVPLEGGRLQVAPLAYNVHTKTWYDATASMIRHFNDGRVDAPLEWTDRMLTFNAACHDCHVSQLRNSYDPTNDAYVTTWKEAGINCETCHGPAEAHIRAAEEAEAKGEKPARLELIRFHDDLTAAQRDDVCSPCHAKMSPLDRNFVPGERFFDHYDLISYENPDFFADGRDLGENYTLTGWMANPCARSGQLECIHCHTSSGRFRFKNDPNQACLPCHEKRVKHIVAHSRHPAKAGLTCISCHMPMTAQAYMRRSDHSFRPPSPRASRAFGSPNACNLCHDNPEAITGDFHGHDPKAIDWAVKVVDERYGPDSGAILLRQGRLVQALRTNDWSVLPQVAKELDAPECDPACAVALLRLTANAPDPAKWPILRKQLRNPHPWVRSAAAAGLRHDPSPESTALLLDACADPLRLVRIRAAESLVGRDLSSEPASRRAAFDAAQREFLNLLHVWPDRWSTHYNQGLYYDRLGQTTNALRAYRKATQLRDDVVQPLVNAAMDHARTGNPKAAREALEKALKIEPDTPAILFNIALLDAEEKRIDDAERHLRAALAADPRMTRAAYNLGILLGQKNDPEALDWLGKANRLDPGNPEILSSILYFLERQGRADDVVPTLRNAIERGGAPADAYFALVRACFERGDLEGARAALKKAADDASLPESARSHAESLLRSLPSP